MKWIPYGRNAILVQFAERPDEWAWRKCRAMVHALEQGSGHRVAEFVPGYTSLLVEFDLRRDEPLAEVAEETMTLLRGAARRKVSPGPLHEIPVNYEGPDLERVAAHNGLTVQQVIKYHTAPIYKVYLLGFAPGFPYLGELHHKLRTPRLDRPRSKVPAGSVAIGGEHTGVYTVPSPGGWNIIGRTETKIFDPADGTESAFLLKQGDRVRFRAVQHA